MRYSIHHCLGEISNELMDSFGGLAPDGYLRSEHCFRYRSYGTAQVKGTNVLWNDDDAFFQKDELNQYAGGLERKFAPLPAAARKFAAGLVATPSVRALVPTEEFEIGCHQIRIVATDEFVGLPAPEGFHRDGFDLVAVNCIALDNVSGGISLIKDRVTGEIIYERAMVPGETLCVDDGEVTHYVSPITPKVPGEASRDVIVITFSAKDGQR